MRWCGGKARAHLFLKCHNFHHRARAASAPTPSGPFQPAAACDASPSWPLRPKAPCTTIPADQSRVQITGVAGLARRHELKAAEIAARNVARSNGDVNR